MNDYFCPSALNFFSILTVALKTNPLLPLTNQRQQITKIYTVLQVINSPSEKNYTGEHPLMITCQANSPLFYTFICTRYLLYRVGRSFFASNRSSGCFFN